MSTVKDHDRRVAILNNYWNAIMKVCGRGVEDMEDFQDNSTIMKAVSLEFFHVLLAPMFNQLAHGKSYTEQDFEKILLIAAENLEGEPRTFLTSEFWKKGGKAGGLNKAHLIKFIPQFVEAISNAGVADDIKV